MLQTKGKEKDGKTLVTVHWLKRSFPASLGHFFRGWRRSESPETETKELETVFHIAVVIKGVKGERVGSGYYPENYSA